eukprot:1964630-Heterocapsa_arctica.AAC.1
MAATSAHWPGLCLGLGRAHWRERAPETKAEEPYSRDGVQHPPDLDKLDGRQADVRSRPSSGLIASSTRPLRGHSRPTAVIGVRAIAGEPLLRTLSAHRCDKCDK